VTTLPSPTEIARHEAAHAAAFCLLGLVPLCVRVDLPTPTLAGSVKLDWERHDPSRDVLRKVLVATLMGPLQDGTHVDDWPVNPAEWDGGAERDADVIAFLIDTLELDEVDWRYDVFKAQRLGCRRDFRRLQVAIAGELERKEIVGRDELIELMEATSENP
jgi:hypothetical protein